MKQKLLVWMRGKLKSHAHKIVDPKVQRKALEIAYKKAEPLVRKTVHAKFPPNDMAICKKYSVAQIDDCIKLQYPNGIVQVFDFNKDTGPLVTQKTYTGQIYLADEKTATAVEAWANARDAFKTEREKRFNAYYALIDGASYLEDLLPVWPEAADIIPKNALPIALGPEQINIIKTDIAERKKAH